MIHYFDASAWVKRYVREPGSELVADAMRDGIAATARYTWIETLSALARLRSEGALDAGAERRIRDALRDDFGALAIVELSAEVVDEAERLLAGHELRAGDALQLASALVLQTRAEVPITFVGFDRRCLEVARAEGMTVAGG